MTVFQLVSITKVDPVKKLLQRASARKKAGEFEDAITTLNEAYREISRTSSNYTIHTFLRLPLYLQLANRQDDAWREFNRLLVEGYPNQLRTSEMLPMDHAVIYDKMRLFLQREQRCREAVKFGIFSYFLWATGLNEQSRKRELRSHMAKNAVRIMLQDLLKKAKLEELYPELQTSISRHLRTFPRINFPLLGNDINAILLH